MGLKKRSKTTESSGKPKKLSVDELLKLACIYAQDNQEELLRAYAHCDQDDPVVVSTKAFLVQLRSYRLKRWGQTRLEVFIQQATEAPVNEIASRSNNS